MNQSPMLQFLKVVNTTGSGVGSALESEMFRMKPMQTVTVDLLDLSGCGDEIQMHLDGC